MSMKKFSLLFFALGLFLPLTSTASLKLNLSYPKFGGIDLENNPGLQGIVLWIYIFMIGIAGLAAFLMIVWGGIQWLSSAGNPAQIGDAKDKIQKALLGLLLILSSVLILNLINPELTNLQSPWLPAPKPVASQAQNNAAPLPDILFRVGSAQNASVKPGEDVTLIWVSSYSSCSGESDPPLSEWQGPVSLPSGSKLLTMTEEGFYRLILTCFKVGSPIIEEMVTIRVSSAPPLPPVNPAVEFRAYNPATGNPYASPIDGKDVVKDTNGFIKFAWSSTGAHECDGEKEFFLVNGPPMGEKLVDISSLAWGDHRYRIRCTNRDTGETVRSDDIIVEISK